MRVGISRFCCRGIGQRHLHARGVSPSRFVFRNANSRLVFRNASDPIFRNANNSSRLVFRNASNPSRLVFNSSCLVFRNVSDPSRFVFRNASNPRRFVFRNAGTCNYSTPAFRGFWRCGLRCVHFLARSDSTQRQIKRDQKQF